MAIYMKLQGAKGNGAAKGYAGWCELDHLHFSITRNAHVNVGQTDNRSQGVPVFSTAQITKERDGASNTLFQYACNGKSIKQVEIHATSTNFNSKPHTKYILSNVVISEIDHALSAHAEPQELINLSFTKIESHYINNDKTNQATSPNIAGYDLLKAEML